MSTATGELGSTSRAKMVGAVTLTTLDRQRSFLDGQAGATCLDLSEVTQLDTAGAWAIASFQAAQNSKGREVTIDNATEAQALLLRTVVEAMPSPRKRRRRLPHHEAGDVLFEVGKSVSSFVVGLGQTIGFFGLVLTRLATTALHPSRLRLTALTHHMQQAGLNAVPIVGLMGFLIGIVLAFQGASQLEQFGAEIYVVDLISISMLRELGILLTAIIVAGRSASSFTAAIGSMKMREEIDAMRVLGLDPIELLVLPRMLALLVMLPILGFVANMTGLVGGALMAWIDLGISPAMFRTQLAANTSVTHALVGLSKAPIFAMIIALVGCYQGLQVEGNTDSLGSRTSRSVVVAIFLVIVVDAIASIFFSIWGV
ncbi:MlaE family lipid ABC transporter permease subunit [Rhodobacter sp. SY28-1]|uniref:ABC transporter permease n=1 Tax=Rhodobacter sp. SY28-1 TaxID=2562317 RepID=UPI001F0ED6E6|nr:MlaE family lipid ABC transporter permease subunit [Rhodobacter sp. SY28-1]